MCVGLVFVMTFFGELVKRSLEPTNLVMFYLLAVVIAAIRWGQGPAIVTAILSVLSFDFFLVPPYLTLGVADIQYLFTFIAFLIVGVVVSTLASKTREHLIQRQTEKLQTALLNSISHDLRTPLASITGSLSALIDRDCNLDDATRKELLGTAFQESERLNRLVGNLLDMTRMEAGALKISRKPCELRDLLGASLEQLKDRIGSRDIRIDIPRDFPDVSIDFSFMMKVFFNLIDNALKYSPQNTSIDIKVSLSQDTVRIEIKDQGVGIPQEDLKRIFDKFYRVQRPHQIKGTGLGLSICKGIVDAHDGQITAINNPDRGATFIINIPLH
ncbi:MAG: ATP-binding protein [Candidatus Omnitrophota bacterium]|nr:ATP-binding protein [Candidatus Omnitrophota bacterium]